MSKAKQKGGSLEYAVHQIEELILRHNPTLRGANVRIHRNRWFNIEGVPFEVDVLVATGSDESPQYHNRHRDHGTAAVAFWCRAHEVTASCAGHVVVEEG